jgi:hypothetical protein
MSELLHKTGAAIVAEEINEAGSLQAYADQQRAKGFIISPATLSRWLRANGYRVENRWVPVNAKKKGNKQAVQA